MQFSHFNCSWDTVHLKPVYPLLTKEWISFLLSIRTCSSGILCSRLFNFPFRIHVERNKQQSLQCCPCGILNKMFIPRLYDFFKKVGRPGLGRGKALNFDCLLFLYCELGSVLLVAFILSVFRTVRDSLISLKLSWLLGLNCTASARLPYWWTHSTGQAVPMLWLF